ncbi:MAG: hypothetical protein V4537_01730 [Pseudomonadota bacterium]
MSFARFHAAHITTLPVELAVLMVGVASRQAASPTARVQATLASVARDDAALAPASGSFSVATAAALTRWKAE